MRTKTRPVPATESGMMLPTLGQGLRVAVAHRAGQILAKAAPATRRPRPSRPG